MMQIHLGQADQGGTFQTINNGLANIIWPVIFKSNYYWTDCKHYGNGVVSTSVMDGTQTEVSVTFIAARDADKVSMASWILRAIAIGW